jgi:hypothetical protein
MQLKGVTKSVQRKTHRERLPHHASEEEEDDDDEPKESRMTL